MIPFVYGTVVTKDFFCGRTELIPRIDELMLSSQNIVMHGERRIGKSSLIAEIIRRQKKISGIYIDLMEVKSEDDLFQRIARALLSAKYKKSMFELLSKTLAGFKPQIGIDPLTQLPTLSIDTRTKIEDNSIDAVFNSIIEINRKQKIAIIMDEFQDILKIKDSGSILAKLRSKIQHLSDISFVFAGSIRNQMEMIFADSNSPFFKSAIPITVGSIEPISLVTFIKKRFKVGKRDINDEIINKIFDITDMITGDIQQVCEAIWSTSSYGDKINYESLSKAIDLIFSHESIVYQQIFRILTNFQLKVVKAVAKYGGVEIYSNNFFEKNGFTNSSSVKRGVDKLIKSQVLFVNKKEYKFVNPFFKLWLLKNHI
ncbi:MAG: AAA family ATPase [Deltaproteobacteria bacterium]|nr:AAA family ATPase [Deltaproteobacteria bacterium]